MCGGSAQIIGCDIHPLNNVRVLKWLAANVPDDKGIADRWYAHWIAEGFRGFEACLLREARHGTYCLGDTLTHGRHLPRAAGRQCPALQLRPLGAFPVTVAIADRVADLPAVQRVAPETQADRF